MTATPGQPAAGGRGIYGNAWRRPERCGCDKVAYRDEATALAAAEQRGAEFDTEFRAYNCPGSSRWHLATCGFRVEALKSRPRMMAWHIEVRGAIPWEQLVRVMGFDPALARPSAAVRKMLKTVRVFAQLGLVAIDERPPMRITAVDNAGLRRVMAVGLEQYAASRGIDLRRRPGWEHGTMTDQASPQGTEG